MKNSFLNPIKELLKGLYTVLKNGFKPDVTLEYPEKRKELNQNFRGKIKYNKDRCIKCKLCQKVCPAKGAITIDSSFKINFSQCIFCGNCIENCPKQALEKTNEYELATTDKKNLILKEDFN